MRSRGNLADVRDSFDAERSIDYRRQDEEAIALGGSYRHYRGILEGLTSSYGRRVDVLEVGCGSGRYFHCLRNVRELVGVDLSPDMIRQARDPVRQHEITAERITLICADAANLKLGERRFDVVYSIGVLGEYSPLDRATLAGLVGLLANGGALFVTGVDSASRMSEPESGASGILRRGFRKLFPGLPAPVRRAANRWLSPHYLSRREVEAVFASSGLTDIEITPYVHLSGWRGIHWDCIGYKR